MGYDVREQWSQKDFTEDVLQGMGSTRYYSVTADTLEEMADDKAVAAANGTGGQIPPYNASHPANRDLRVAAKNVGPGLNERIVSVRYQFAQGGLTFEPNNNPLSRKPRFSWSYSTYLDPQARDIHGQLIVNSARDPVEPSPSIPKRSRILTIKRFEQGYRPEVADRFENTVNATEMFAAGRRLPPGTVLVQSIIPIGEYTDAGSIVEMEYTLEIRARFGGPKSASAMEADPFLFWHADIGLRSNYKETDGTDRIGDLYEKLSAGGHGDRVSESIPLNGFGVPAEAAKYVVTLASKTPATGLRTRASKLHRVSDTLFFLGWEIYRADNHLLLGL